VIIDQSGPYVLLVEDEDEHARIIAEMIEAGVEVADIAID
jgi:hypothetical protein